MAFHTRETIKNYIAAGNKCSGEFPFSGCRGRDRPIPTRRCASDHQRRAGPTLLWDAFAAPNQSYRRTGNVSAVQLFLGHMKMENTVRYLGIEVDNTLAMAEQVDV